MYTITVSDRIIGVWAYIPTYGISSQECARFKKNNCSPHQLERCQKDKKTWTIIWVNYNDLTTHHR